MLRVSLGAALLALTLIGCEDNRPVAPPPRPAEPPPRTPSEPPPAERDTKVRVNTPGADVNVDRQNKKVDVNVNPK